MSLPVNMEFRDFSRYLVSGLITFFLYYPYLRQLSYWNTADPTEELALTLIFIVVAGIIINAMVTPISGIFTHPPQSVGRLRFLWDRWRHPKPEKQPTKFRIIIRATNEEREILRNETAAGYMAGGCALILISYIFFTMMNLVTVLFQQAYLPYIIFPLLIAAVIFEVVGLKLKKRIVGYVKWTCYLSPIIVLLVALRSVSSPSLQGQPLIPQLWPPDLLIFIFVLLGTAAFILTGRIHYKNYQGFYEELKKTAGKRPDPAEQKERAGKRRQPNKPRKANQT